MYEPITSVKTGSGSNMVLAFYADDSIVRTSVNLFDAVVIFDTAEAIYVSETLHAQLDLLNENEGVINSSGISPCRRIKCRSPVYSGT